MIVCHVAFALCLSFPAKASAEPTAPTAGDHYDFGSASIGDQVTHDFIFSNTTNEIVYLKEVQTSCPCAKVMFFPEKIEPKSKGKISVLFQPEKAGTADIKIDLEAVGIEKPIKTFVLIGKVRESFSAAQRAAKPDGVYRLEWLAAAKNLMDQAQKGEKPCPERSRRAVFLDVRNPEKFRQAHIPSSINLPLYEVKTKNYLRSKNIVLVDEGLAGDPVLSECRRLHDLKFESVRVLEGGLRGWQQAGGKLEGEKITGAALATISASEFYQTGKLDGWLLINASSGKSAKVSNLGLPVKSVVYKKDPKRFAEDLKEAVQKAGKVSKVLILTERGQDYDKIESQLQGPNSQFSILSSQFSTLNSQIYYLAGGMEAYTQYAALQAAIKNRREIKLADNSIVKFGASAGIPKRGGCGSCP